MLIVLFFIINLSLSYCISSVDFLEFSSFLREWGYGVSVCETKACVRRLPAVLDTVYQDTFSDTTVFSSRSQ